MVTLSKINNNLCPVCFNIAWTPVPKDYESRGDAQVIIREDKDYNEICSYCELKEYLYESMTNLQYMVDAYTDPLDRERCYTLPNGDCINRRCKLHFEHGMDIIERIENANKRRA